ncbi:GTA-gp10 family protein [Novosphingobium humi]|uniref:GTA-gp10 family protein n=1 Tax=Novosphingobium humi TaxID=2282397 RepID=A0ABY7U0Y4_9SPHN|nr:GTA-gp10 family protein [Novosphingobium humi]WCT78878.1 GTA-gp10 family protein [Novosphingobium humi]
MAARRSPRAGQRAQPEANAVRGEVSLTLGGVKYRLRPTSAAALAIEDELGGSMLALCQRAGAVALGYRELGVIAGAFIRAGAAPDDKLTANINNDVLADLIYAEGQVKVLGILSAVMANVVNGGYTPQGEPRAVTANG